MPHRTVWIEGAILGAALAGCGGVDVVDPIACDPIADSGCPRGERCRIAEDGARLCLAPEAGSSPAGACTAGSCEPGEACARVEGHLACRRVCALASPVCGDAATCGYALDDTYGVCVSPCRPFPKDGVEDCPGGACAPILGLAYPICVAVGPGRLGDPCQETRCGRALACLAADDGVRCRALCVDGEDDLCPPPQTCSGEVAERGLGYCRAP